MEAISIGQSLVITLFSMVVVFLVLIGISFLIDLLRLVVERLESKGEEEVKEFKETKNIEVGQESEPGEDLSSDEELVAVISAAVAVSMGVDVPDINIKTIKRVENSWKNVARNEQVFKNI